MQDQDLDGENMYGCVLTKLVAGCHSDANAKVKKVANRNLLSTHCMYRCKHIASQKRSPELNDIMIRPVKIINYS